MKDKKKPYDFSDEPPIEYISYWTANNLSQEFLEELQILEFEDGIINTLLEEEEE